MARARFIVCACGEKREVPPRGPTPKRCYACADKVIEDAHRRRALARSRRPEIKARRRELAQARGYWNRRA